MPAIIAAVPAGLNLSGSAGMRRHLHIDYRRFAKSMFRFWFSIFILWLCAPTVWAADAGIQNIIRDRIESGGFPLKISIAGEPIYAAAVLPRFFEQAENSRFSEMERGRT